MDKLTINPMPKERILKTLYELKHREFGKTPSKYFFALGHAIRSIEAENESGVEADAKCSSDFHKEEYSNGSTFCRVCGKRIRTA